MKKTLIAFGAALVCMGAAQAQSTVQMSGLVDMYVGSMKAPGGARTSQMGSGGLTTSWWGMNGTEDLGNGLKVGFALGAFFRADTGEPGRWNLGGNYGENFFARDANVSLSGGFGSVKLGRSMAPNFLPTILFNPYGDSFTVSPLVVHANMGWGAGQNHFLKTTAADTGWSNQITYSTPKFGGLSANVHYQFGEVAGQNSKKNVGANVLFFQGPLALTAFIERAQINNPTTWATGNTKQNWMLGASYDFTVAKLYATHGQSKLKNNNSYEAKTTSLGLDVPVTKAGTFKAAAAYTKVDVNAPQDVKRTTYTLGYDHFLSKRTDVYSAVMYDKIKQANSESGTSVAVGIRHRF
jgi:predicted porin